MLWKLGFISINRPVDDSVGSFFVLELINFYYFIFEHFIIFKIIFKYCNKMPRQFIYIGKMIDSWIFCGHSYYFIILFAIVYHLHIANYGSLHQAQGLDAFP